MMGAGMLLAVGGSACGAVCRYASGEAIAKVNHSDFPWATWLVNMMGTLLLGLFTIELTRLHNHPDWYLLLGTGFCGGFTTFSTMSVEAVQLFKKQALLGIVYLGSSLAFGLVLAWATQWWL